MIILEAPYISTSLLVFLEETQVPVLANNVARGFSEEYPHLNLLDELRFVELVESPDSRGLYAVSEYALTWIYKALRGNKLVEQVALLKNKVAFRQACKHMHEDLYFKEIGFNDLFGGDIAEVPLPVVLKPSTGFLSAGVYTIESAGDWENALCDIRKHFKARAAMFPGSVVDGTSFIIESYIAGREFAIDLYFNGVEPVIINIFEHHFASTRDVSDRLYCTSKDLFDTYLEPFTAYASRLNSVLNLRDIPVHMELRVDNNAIVPIEINPLRFAGLCLNDLHQHISGNHPLSYFFMKTKPDYQAMWKGKETQMFCFSVFEKTLDVEARIRCVEDIRQLFSCILEFRGIDVPKLDVSAIVFSRTETCNKEELRRIANYEVNHAKKDSKR